MRAELGIVVLALGLWLAGAAILLGAGVMQLSRRSVLVWSGASYLVGVAAVGLLLTLATIAGVRGSTPLTALAIGLVALAGAACARLVRVPALPPRELPRDRGFRIFAAVVFGLFLVGGTGVALVMPIAYHDAWAIWDTKSLLLYDHGTIPAEFTRGAYAFSHPDYPILWPVLEAAHYRVMGGPEPKLVTLPHWLLYVGFAGTVAAVGARLTRPALWVPIALGTLLTYSIFDQLFWHYADVPTAALLGGGALFGGLWVAGHGTRWLVPCAVLLAAAANGKNEGLTAAGAVVAALFVAALLAGPGLRRRAVLSAVGLAVFVGAAVLPWRLWLSANDVEGDIKASRALDPGALSDASGRVEPTATRLWDTITNPRQWGYIVFAALVLIGVALARRATRRLGAYYGVTGGLVFFFLLLAYWVAETDLNWHLNTSADRVVHLVGFAAIAATLHLAAALYEERADEEVADP